MVVQSNIRSSSDQCIFKSSSELLPPKKVVDLVFGHQVRGHLGSLVYPFVLEKAPTDDEACCGPQVGRALPVLIHLAQALFSHYVLVVTANLGAELTHGISYFSSRPRLDDGL